MLKSLLLFSFLAPFLLIQTTQSAPITNSDSEEELFDELNYLLTQVANHIRLLEVSYTELSEINEYVAENGKELLKKVVNDPKVLEVKDDAIEKIRNEILEYENKLENFDTNSEYNLDHVEYLNFESLVNKYKNGEVDNLTPAAEVVRKSLNENGLENFEKDIENHFREFSTRFVEEIDELASQLSDDDIKDEESIFEWSNRFAAESDVEKKLEIFNEFFEGENEDENDKEENDKEE